VEIPVRPGKDATARELYEYSSTIARDVGDYEAWANTFADDAILEIPFPRPAGIPGRIEGRAEIHRILGGGHKKFVNRFITETLYQEIHESADKQTLVSEVSILRTDRETGEQFPTHYVHRVTVKDGEYVLFRDYASITELQPQLPDEFANASSVEESRDLAEKWLANHSLPGGSSEGLYSADAQLWQNHTDAFRAMPDLDLSIHRQVAPDFEATDASINAWPGGFAIDFVWSGTVTNADGADAIAVRAPTAVTGQVKNGQITLIKEFVDPSDLAPIADALGEKRIAELKARAYGS
jgi:ketosteroid isomerase-like protein